VNFSFFLFFFLRVFVASLILAAILYKRLGSVGLGFGLAVDSLVLESIIEKIVCVRARARARVY
jgi:hypothetical protein